MITITFFNMYYTSTNKAELEAYDTLVTQGEGYDGVKTIKWANIIEHKDGNLFAILANNKYDSDLNTLENLEGWFEEFNF